MSDMGTAFFSPSRTTIALGAVIRLSLATVRLLFISCTMPIVVFATAITKNSIWLNFAPTVMSAAATMKIMRLKNVNRLDMKM